MKLAFHTFLRGVISEPEHMSTRTHLNDSALRAFNINSTGLIAALAAMVVTGCAPMTQKVQEVDANPPSVSYEYISDAELVEANRKAQNYCSQYIAAPSLRGSITENPEGTKTVTFECLKVATVVPYAVPVPVPTPTPPPVSYNYSYRTDAQLLDAIYSADSYCARTGQDAVSQVDTNTNGSKSLTYHCVPR